MADIYGDLYGDIYGDLFTPGSGPADGIKVEVDWDRNGDFSSPLENITAYVRTGGDPVSVSMGRDPGTSGSVVVQGQGGMTLDNSDRRFSSRNTASPLYGLIKPARPVRVTRSVGGSTYTLFRGHTDETPLNPDPSAKSVSLSLVDYLGDFRGQDISTPMYRGIRTGEAIGYVLDACDWDPGLRDIDSGATVLPWWWEYDTDAMTALDKLVRAEGAPALLTIGSSGEVIFRDRHHRLKRAASNTSQGTWRSKGRIQPVIATGFTYDEAWPNIVNRASISVDQRQAQPQQVVWTQDVNMLVTVGNPQTVWAKPTDPVINAVVPSIANGDIIKGGIGSGTVTATLLATSGQTIGVTLTASLGSVRIATLQLRAQPVTVESSTVISAVPDAASNADYGPKAFTGDVPWVGAEDAQAICDQQVADRAQPLPVVKARFVVGTNAASAAAILVRDLSDRVTVQEDETVLNDDFFIESIQHTLTGQYDHEVEFALEHVPPTMPTPFILGTSVLNGTDVLGR